MFQQMSFGEIGGPLIAAILLAKPKYEKKMS